LVGLVGLKCLMLFNLLNNFNPCLPAGRSET
jgi:hypothetical protein